MEVTDTPHRSQLENSEGRTGRGQSNRVEAAGEDEYNPDSKRKPTAEQCPRKDNGNWHDLWRSGQTNGYRRSTRQGKVLWVWRNWTLQMGLPQTAQDEGRGITTSRILLGPCSDKGEDRLKSGGGKRWSRAVNDSTGSAKDLVSPGTHSTPASQTHRTSVVDVTVHLNIPAPRLYDQE